MELYPPLDVMRLNMTCGAANGYWCLSLCYEKRLEVFSRCLGFTFEIEKYITLFSWEKFTSYFPHLAKFIGK